MKNDWQNHETEVAAFFRSLGLIADTDLTLQGIRTTHDIDVVVRSQHVGLPGSIATVLQTVQRV